ncbi:16S rRNA (uracil(1498)-N(3))-methyltransferase [Paenalkalicoccus suaedae]|uniref:Ribosomal RNA small subunit methyltransferase E n=1 Tax=Paenalkalicoccus suaedae TaxID=2592382 RepID=A0A859FDF5_9BACI|nr:16S rRNA (uracil(1498)-N(3))-methyltransferase [Paenalkalicoccus suaedae]QKS70851.1 16S rRNA (uracil(1498)-N(3))-methyltransferase [Paenalkalicoccus suaedae]
MQRYFLPNDHFTNGYVKMDDESTKHIARVMRMKNDDEVICCNEDGSCYIVALDVAPDEVRGRVLYQEERSSELPVDVTIAQGLPKGDKLELTIQKATELGAFSFLPFEATRSVAKLDAKKADKKVERWQRIAKEASEQSHRQRVPNVTFVSWQELLTSASDFTHVIVAYEEAAKEDERSSFKAVLQKLSPGDRVLLVCGPEGGLTDAEVKKLEEVKAIRCGLGPRILRSETAPLYGLSAISYQIELSG